MDNKVLNYSNTKAIPWWSLSQKICIFLGLGCFTLSLFLPVFFTSAEDILGFWVLISGWIGLIFIQFAWYANPLNLLAILLAHDNPRIALLFSCLALVIASGTFNFYEIPIGLNYEKVFIKEFGAGFYLWITAHIFVTFALIFRFLESLQKD